MRDEDKSKEELIEELAELRSRLSEVTGPSRPAVRKNPDSPTPEDQPGRQTFLQAVIDAVSIPIFYKDSTGRYIGCNPAFEEATGRSAASLAGKTIYDIAPAACADKHLEHDSVVLRGEGPRVYETRIRHSDGSVRDVVFSKAALTGADGQPVGLVGTMTDVTGFRLAERDLRAAEAKYRAFYEETPDYIFISTLDGRLLDLNPAGYEGFGVSTKEELSKINLARDIYQDQRDRDRFRQAMQDRGFVKDYEVSVKRVKDGSPAVVSLTASLMKDASGKVVGYRGVVKDITEKKALEQQLIQSQKMEAIGTLTGGIAHDFNNMIMAINSYATLLSVRLEEAPEHANYAEQILGVTERATNLTKRLLAFSRKRIAALKPESLNGIITEVEGLLGAVIGKDVEFKTSLAETDFILMADGGQIEQVLVNMATNARDAMPRGGTVTVATDLVELGEDFVKAHGYGEPGRYACIAVSDTGTGMDEETRKRVFDPFFTTKEAGKGTGLGLSIAYGIVKQHNGFINVYSEPGFGTTFKIFLPVADTAAPVVNPRPSPRSVAVGGKETVLVAEDDGSVRSTTMKVLEDFGYNVVSAVDGEDAINKFRSMKDEIELLILDVMMPRKNGPEVLSETVKITPGIKALFVSGYNEEMITTSGMLEEGISFLSKPVLPAELLRKVRDVLNG